MRYSFYILFLYFFIIPLNGQNSIDSLQGILKEKINPDKEKIDILNTIGYEYWIIDSKKSLEYGTKSLKLAEELSYTMGIAKARRIIGVSYWTMGQHKLALENLIIAKRTYEQVHDEEGIGNCLMNTGMIYVDIEEYDKALELYNQAIVIFTKLGLKSRIATTFTKIGIVFIKKKRLYDAKEYLTNALSIHTENNFTYGIAEAHNKLGTLFLIQGELEQANHHINEALIMGTSINDEDGLINNLILFGKLLRIRKNYDASETHLNLALEKAKKKQLKKYELDIYEELKLLKKEQNKLEESLKYCEVYTTLKDSIYNRNKSRQIAILEFSHELEEKENELNYLNQQKQFNSLVQMIMIVGVSIIIILSFFLIRSLKLKNKKQQALIVSNDLTTKTLIENQYLKEVELEQQLHFKNKELVSYALNFVQKNELLENLYQIIKDAKNTSAKNQGKAYNEIEKTIRKHTSIDKDWEDFKTHFEKVHTNFLKKLKEKFNHLTSNDLKVAALTRLNLTIKETSSILGISIESTKTARYRLRKKLGINQNEGLFSFLIQIEGEKSESANSYVRSS